MLSGVKIEEVTDEDSCHNAEDKQQYTLLQSGTQPGLGKTWNHKKCRRLPVISKKFTITVNQKKWKKIVPLHGSTKLRQPWTNVLYNSFREKNLCCTLAFKSQHIKTPHSRKTNCPYLNISAVCTFPSCSAKYLFKKKREPLGETLVKISVLQSGRMKHKTTEKKFRQASNTRRGRIAPALRKGISILFYNKL